MASSSMSKNTLENMLECCICMQEYTDPRSLPCLHTFCLKCLEQTGQGKQPEENMSCPMCRKEFLIPAQGFKGIQKNFFMEKLMEINKLTANIEVVCDFCCEEHEDDGNKIPDAVKYCIECKQKICEDCCKAHKKVKTSKDHQLVDLRNQEDIRKLSKIFTKSFCTVHTKETIKMYCSDCKDTICLICFAENHQSHKCAAVNRVAEDFRITLEDTIEKISNCLNESLHNLEITNEKVKIINEKIANIETFILKRVEEIKEMVDRHAKELLEELNLIKLERMKQMQVQREELERHITMLESYERYIKEVKQGGSDVDVCRSVPDMNARSNELEQDNKLLFENQTIEGENIVFSKSNSETFWTVSKNNMIGKIHVLNTIGKINLEGVTIQGLACLQNKIYIISSESEKISVFSNETPFGRLEEDEFIIEEMQGNVIISSARKSLLVISDDINKCYWKVTMPGKQVTKCLVDKIPYGISWSNSDDLLVCSRGQNNLYYIDIYNTSEDKLIKTIPLATNITVLHHAIQSLSNNIIISYETGEYENEEDESGEYTSEEDEETNGENEEDESEKECAHEEDEVTNKEYFVSEISADGDILRSCNPLVESIYLGSIWGLSIDEVDNVIMADCDNNRVILLDNEMSHGQTIFSIEGLLFCYLHNQERIIIAHKSSSDEGNHNTISIVNINPFINFIK